MARRAAALVGALGAALLASCATPATVEVRVPVAVRAQPPPELLRCTKTLPRPTFTACCTDGWSCLAPAEEDRLRALVDRLLRCNDGWAAWATAP